MHDLFDIQTGATPTNAIGAGDEAPAVAWEPCPWPTVHPLGEEPVCAHCGWLVDDHLDPALDDHIDHHSVARPPPARALARRASADRWRRAS